MSQGPINITHDQREGAEIVKSEIANRKSAPLAQPFMFTVQSSFPGYLISSNNIKHSLFLPDHTGKNVKEDQGELPSGGFFFFMGIFNAVHAKGAKKAQGAQSFFNCFYDERKRISFA